MRNLFIILTVFACCLNSAAQGISGQKIKTIPGDFVSFSIDNLDNIYLLTTTNQLKKYNSNGDSISVFNDTKRFGKVSMIDVSNPVKILLYYQGFSTIALLDGVFNLKSTIDLRKKGIFNAEAISMSYDGKIWLFDETDNTLKKLDDQGNTVFKTADFRQLFDEAITPVSIFDQNQYVYLYDSTQGIFVFDYYGAFKKKIDITNWNQLRVVNHSIYGEANNKLYRLNTNTLEQTVWPVPEFVKDSKQLFYNGKILYALDNTGLSVYK